MRFFEEEFGTDLKDCFCNNRQKFVKAQSCALTGVFCQKSEMAKLKYQNATST